MLAETTVLKRKRKVNLQSLPGAWIDDEQQEKEETSCDQDIELLKQTIANLRKEKQKLEETNDIVKKSIQIVARKRLIAQKKNLLLSSDTSSEEEDEEDIYVVVPNDSMPSQEEMNAAGLDGWEWISAYTLTEIFGSLKANGV
ncbi:hypothetical protein EDC94DRAFT_563089 [Helicostylum pulchrum]|uniref:Uncharacterized protein n=1 Tax=Helicostylum pulchrum TaxID=562976 RepID=A0ABP9Y7L8_9FUNG|nr:hypothetical protein EDC94DRAFT_563089 [Helicostylum pulchrum]